METTRAAEILSALKENINRVIVGKNDVVELLLTALVSGGHVLLEDVPGTGKTVLAKSLARSLDADFRRIQFTPDLLPSDVTGLNFFSQKTGDFVFRAGPVFCHILLADEINRATPRTQSSLLECMAERQVTIDGERHVLASPFLVIATQNPIETAGTFPLPEAQLDRFLMMLTMGLPELAEERAIVDRFLTDDPLETLSPVCTRRELLDLQACARQVYLHPLLRDYLCQLVLATRNASGTVLGVSPRGTLALAGAVRAYSLLNGRDFVTPEDVKRLAVPVLSHRVSLQQGVFDRASGANFIEGILRQLPVPTERWDRRS